MTDRAVESTQAEEKIIQSKQRLSLKIRDEMPTPEGATLTTTLIMNGSISVDRMSIERFSHLPRLFRLFLAAPGAEPRHSYIPRSLLL